MVSGSDGLSFVGSQCSTFHAATDTHSHNERVEARFGGHVGRDQHGRYQLGRANAERGVQYELLRVEPIVVGG